MSFLQDGISHRWWCKQYQSVWFPGPSLSSIQDSVIKETVILVQFTETEVFHVVLWQGVGVQQLLQSHQPGVQHLLVSDSVFVKGNAVHHKIP